MRLRFPTILVILAANFTVPSLVRADWILSTLGAAQAVCAVPKPGTFIQSTQIDTPNVIAITDGASSDGFCPGKGGGPTSASYLVHAAFNDVSGSVKASFGGAALARANYTDDVTLHPPEGFVGDTVTFGMVANYNVQIDFSGLAGDASAFLFFHVLGRDFAFKADTAGGSPKGSSSGLLQTTDLTLTAPFTTEFQLGGGADVDVVHANASASFSDPINFILPPGWTYTLASQETSSAIPEPGSWTLVFSAFSFIAIRLIRRRRTGTLIGGDSASYVPVTQRR